MSDDSVNDELNAYEWARPADGEGPGLWAARLRLTIEESVQVRLFFVAQGGFELFLDGEAILHSDSEINPDGITRDVVELDLSPGRHELFARLWTILDGPPPPFQVEVDRQVELFSTRHAPWVAARMENVGLTHPLLARVLMMGEPTGPEGMDRGADWQPVVPVPEYGVGSFDPAVTLEPVHATEGWEAELLEGEATLDEFRSVFGPDGFFRIEPQERAIIRLALPNVPVYLRLRASGGENALIRIGTEEDPINADIYMPRGFRQDFASLAPFLGSEMTISLEGGERGMALFRLEFLGERER